MGTTAPVEGYKTTDVAPGNRTLELRRADFTVPVVIESNDILFTIRSDDSSRIADVATGGQASARDAEAPRRALAWNALRYQHTQAVRAALAVR